MWLLVIIIMSGPMQMQQPSVYRAASEGDCIKALAIARKIVSDKAQFAAACIRLEEGGV